LGKGGEGAIALAEAVIKAAEKPADFRFLYPLDAPIKEKIEIICREIYGADGVDYAPLAEERLSFIPVWAMVICRFVWLRHTSA
jgi:formyltetrahydrofolate synthetase